MTTTTTIRSAQRAFPIVEWWNAKSESYSDLTGEYCTHGEAVAANAALVAGIALMCGAVALLNAMLGMEGGAL